MLSKVLHIGSLAALTLLAFVNPTFAASSGEVFDKATDKAAETFENIRLIIFIVGGFGLVGLAFAAIFGKVHWKWAAGLGLGLFILAVAQSVVLYATGESAQGLDDTLN